MNAQSLCWYEITAVVENTDTSIADEVLRWNKKRFVSENGCRVFDEQEARKELDRVCRFYQKFYKYNARQADVLLEKCNRSRNRDCKTIDFKCFRKE